LIQSIEDKDYQIRIADMGLAAFTPNDEVLYQKCGTPGYVAPEIFQKHGYSYKADIFSLGCVFFNLLTSCYMFVGRDHQELLYQNMDCNLDHVHKYVEWATPQCKDLLLKMCSKDPALRPTAKECLMHPWFAQDKAILKELLFINNMMCSDNNLNQQRMVKERNGSSNERSRSR
jgi:serine/threonine protein kinase